MGDPNLLISGFPSIPYLVKGTYTTWWGCQSNYRKGYAVVLEVVEKHAATRVTDSKILATRGEVYGCNMSEGRTRSRPVSEGSKGWKVNLKMVSGRNEKKTNESTYESHSILLFLACDGEYLCIMVEPECRGGSDEVCN